MWVAEKNGKENDERGDDLLWGRGGGSSHYSRWSVASLALHHTTSMANFVLDETHGTRALEVPQPFYYCTASQSVQRRSANNRI